jgi:Nucleotidyl transferase AbiEii toxin, Type IV TA system
MAIADPAHERLIRVGLVALADRGFVLAGGYALAAHGIGSRPSDDVDFFTDRRDCDFGRATDELAAAYRADGHDVAVVRQAPEFVRLVVSRRTSVDLARDYRSRPAVRLDLGPVLDLEDAAGSKVATIYGRAAAKDFLDLQELLGSGFTAERLLELGDRREAVPLDRRIFAAQLASVDRIADAEFTRYGVEPARVAELRSTMLAWSEKLRAGSHHR